MSAQVKRTFKNLFFQPHFKNIQFLSVRCKLVVHSSMTFDSLTRIINDQCVDTTEGDAEFR